VVSLSKTRNQLIFCWSWEAVKFLDSHELTVRKEPPPNERLSGLPDMTIDPVEAHAHVLVVFSAQFGKSLRNCEFICRHQLPPRYELPFSNQGLVTPSSEVHRAHSLMRSRLIA